ncbi:flavin reductase family protein [Leekyejoonella antrihumi]|uniref:2Fe-2S iron-sulfur cluster binding domain-containing protein n=1 Tax=Leekyejoonella antrihumi TaxID=1660198 RepID=A0A563DSS8_9MICO|nr:FAD-binding oxidoreductase [Leekyejoonella antrihumi]TWP32992.1 2Fe-2S iron-sulfur cluster binding domain-containing protein [Leekyejoonella antrihumi]
MTTSLAEPINVWREYWVSRRHVETADVITLTLHAPDNRAQPGQHLILLAPVEGGLRREYSLSRIGPDELDITVKREGVVSRWLHDSIEVGDRLEATAPRGSFLLGDRSDPLVLLSCGIGVTPLLAMAREALARGRAVHFIHVARDRAHHALRGQIEALQGSGGLVRHTTYKHAEQGSADCDHVGEFTTEHLTKLLPAGPAEIKICGPSRFMQAMYDATRQLGIARDDVAWEAFGPSTVVLPEVREPSRLEDPEQPRVIFAKTGSEARWDPECGNLLDFAEEHGVFPNYSCRQGSCDSCRRQWRAVTPNTSTNHSRTQVRDSCCSAAAAPPAMSN